MPDRCCEACVFGRGEHAPWCGKNAEELARLFHETYEQLAPSFGYQTRRESATSWDQVPENNRKLMIATAVRVLKQFPLRGNSPAGPTEAQVSSDLRKGGGSPPPDASTSAGVPSPGGRPE